MNIFYKLHLKTKFSPAITVCIFYFSLDLVSLNVLLQDGNVKHVGKKNVVLKLNTKLELAINTADRDNLIQRELYLGNSNNVCLDVLFAKCTNSKI